MTDNYISTMIKKFPYNDIISLLDENLPLNLAESTSEDLLVENLLDDQFLQTLKKVKLGYGTSRGNELLRQRLAIKSGVGAGNVLITNGASASLFLAIFTLCEKGDEVITVSPNFPPTLDVISAVGAIKKTIDLNFDNQYSLDIEAIKNIISAKTKLVILVSPHNPSGTTITEEDVDAVLLLLKHTCPDAFLLIDETYREAVYGSNPVTRSYADRSDKIICVASFSKCHGAPGIRVGWLTCHDENLMGQLILAKMNTVISCSVVDEALAIAILEKEEQIFSQKKKLLNDGLSSVVQWVNNNRTFIDWVKPSAGALCCIRLNTPVFDNHLVEQFYARLHSRDLQVAPGNWFGQERRIFRLGFGFLTFQKLETALDELQNIFIELTSEHRQD